MLIIIKIICNNALRAKVFLSETKLRVDCEERSGGLTLQWKAELNVILQSFSKGHIDVLIQGQQCAWSFTAFMAFGNGHEGRLVAIIEENWPWYRVALGVCRRQIGASGKKIEKCHTGTSILSPYPGPWRVGSRSRNFIPGGYGFESGSKFHYQDMGLDLGIVATELRWKPPPAGSYKVIIDGDFTTEKARAGVVIRDGEGDVITSMAIRLYGIVDVGHAKAMAI
ncbi:hypothetical protein M9H77_23914 [Catharanthus roseus]|uniref:Uncharacterized protein n=1 Tax=Catharanthus roseus TaxID=4058 RepID=A0ACC0AYR5_CATRO|nr:hypothetical protein M9H77_23914 [Catharanthus roseus]